MPFTTDERVEMARQTKADLVQNGDPFCGDDYSAYQTAVWALELHERVEALEAEAELYRRGYDLIGACDISNYLAKCEGAGKQGDTL